MGRLVTVADKKDIPPGSARAVEVEGRLVAVFNVDGTFYAIDDACSHNAGPLSGGDVDGTVVTCPWHGACFDVTTGEVLGPPAIEAVGRYDVQVDGNEVKIEVS